MNINNTLDEIRLGAGNEKCADFFDELYQKDSGAAINMLNAPDLRFPSLYILMPKIGSLNIETEISPRDTITLQIIRRVLDNADTIDLSEEDDSVRSVLHWMIETGADEYGLDGDYIKILDIAASVLINTYNDKSILPHAAEMIFARAKKGLNVHNLVWAFFRIEDPDALKLIAQRLISPDADESGLARSLLNIETLEIAGNNQEQYEGYLAWLSENDPFLYFTGESFQYSSAPVMCNVDLERKYIQQCSESYGGEPVTAGNQFEEECITVFKPLENDNKKLLSDYSNRIHAKDVSEWEKWIGLPIDEQIRIAKAGTGELL